MPGGRGAFSLRRRLQVLVAGLVVVLVAGGVNTLRLIDTRDEALDLVIQRLDPAREDVNQLEAALVDQQAAVQGFLLTGREETLEPYQRAIDRQRDALTTLADLLAGLPPEPAVAAVGRGIEEWRTSVVAPQISAKRGGREGEARALTATGESTFTEVRLAVDRLRTGVQDEFERAQNQFAAARSGVTRIIVANIGVAGLLTVMATVFMRRWVMRPLDELRADVEAVAAGALDRPVGVDSPAELAALGADVEAMRQRILAELEEVRRAHEGLAQRAPVVLALREALAPRTVEVPAGFEFATLFEPAEGVLAGDWYDAFVLPGGRVALAMGDVAGHGAEAGLFAMRAKDLLIAGLRLGLAPGDAVGLVAEELGELDEGFVTCVVAEVDAEGRVRYANAGHPAPLVAGPSGTARLEPTGPLLGPMAARWETGEARLPPGGVLVCYTDGVVEAASEGGEEYGAERLAAAVAGTRAQGTAAVVEGCSASLRAHSPLGRSRDDVTLVALGRSAG